MGDDYFYGVTLSKDNKELKWEPDELKENGANLSLAPRGDHCLLLKQALITEGTKDELNIVEVETSGYKSVQIKLPVVALTPGADGTALQQLDVNLPDPPVVLRLLKGSGPVHIIGVHAIQADQFEDDDDEEEMDAELEEEKIESEEEIEEPVEEPKPVKGKKRTQSSNGQAPASKKKKEKEAA